MKTKPAHRCQRGVADPATLVVLAVAFVLIAKTPSGRPGKNHWWEFWKKNPIEQVDQARAAVDTAAAQIDAEKAKQLALAQEAAIATGSAIAAAQSTAAAGVLPVKELATAATLNATNTQAMEQALGAAAPARVRELEAMVANLNAGVAAGTKALELMQGTLDRTIADKAAAQTALDAARAELAEKERDLQTFAGERDAIARQYERLTFFGRLGLLLFAGVLGYVLLLLIRTRRLGSFAKDAVGMTEVLKGEIKKRTSAEEYAAVKEMMARDWMTAADGTAQLVAKTKEALRL